jgi:hypothetical protein
MRTLNVKGTRLDVLGLIQYAKTAPLEAGETQRQRERLIQDLSEASAASARSGKLWRVRCGSQRRAVSRKLA